jgi:hypothetical protein
MQVAGLTAATPGADRARGRCAVVFAGPWTRVGALALIVE